MNLPKSFLDKRAVFRSKVARRVFFLFILCALIPLSVLAYYAFNQVTGNLYSQANRQLHQASKASGMTIYERLLFLETELDRISSMLPKGNEDLPARSVCQRIMAA
jgi:predicted PurR-regulated permease PerM